MAGSKREILLKWKKTGGTPISGNHHIQPVETMVKEGSFQLIRTIEWECLGVYYEGNGNHEYTMVNMDETIPLPFFQSLMSVLLAHEHIYFKNGLLAGAFSIS